MGRAYEVRKVSIQKTGAVKAKLYSMYAREIYQTAKTGGTDPIGNLTLKRLIEKAKKDQVPSDIIKRAIDKVSSGALESYDSVCYEIFGPNGSTLLVECLTDNVNRSVSSVRAVLNKCKSKMGVSGSVSFNYDHLCVVSFKGLSEEETLNVLIEHGIDIDDIEERDDQIIIYGAPQDLYQIKEAIIASQPRVEFDMEETVKIPKDKITLVGDDLELFQKMLTLLEDIEDVQQVYHNVILEQE